MDSLPPAAERVLDRLAGLRQQLIDRFGTDGIHALEDGAMIGAVVGLWVTFQPAAVVLAVGLGASPRRASLIAILGELLSLVASDARRRQESYFAGGLLGGAVGGLLVGTGLSLAAASHGVAVPTAAEMLRALAAA